MWLGLSAKGALRHHFATFNTEKTQRRLLQRIISENSEVWYGSEYGFNRINSYEEFAERVPIALYSHFEPLVQRIARGEKSVLSSGVPVCFEPTSGSTSAGKLIPYTPELQSEFQNGIDPWISNMLRHNLHLLTGRAYWSISPVMSSPGETSGGIPVGFESDLSYLHPVVGRYYSRCMAVPTSVGELEQRDVFRYCTAAFLLAADDLRFVSVWNPTFLLLILSAVEERWEEIAADMQSGILTLPDGVPGKLAESLQRKWRKDTERASVLKSVLSRELRNGYQDVWPHLKVISCWADGASQGAFRELSVLFPGTKLIPKGLLATEGIVSIPLEPHSTSVLALTSHFFEFVSESGKVFPAWKLKTGERYSVLLTTGGGLYRYMLGDIVEVTGFARSCPLLRFTGRQNVSDLYGEKLHESHVEEIVRKLFPDKLPFVFLAPAAPKADHYTLYISEVDLDTSVVRDVVERGLCTNVHYDYCRRLGQLNRVEIRVLPMSSVEAHRHYLEACTARGIKTGDIKPSFLEHQWNWFERLTGMPGAVP